MQFYVYVKLGVGQGYHNFQIHQEVHVSLDLRLFFFFFTMYSLLPVRHYRKICIKIWLNTGMVVYDRKKD